MDNKSHIIPIADIKSLIKSKKMNVRVACQLFKENIQKAYIRLLCTLNNSMPAYVIETDFEISGGTDGTFNDIRVHDCKDGCAILVDSYIPYLELDQKTDFVTKHNVADIVEEKGTFNVNDSVLVFGNCDKMRGIIKRSGRINGIFCYAVDLDPLELSDDEKRHCIVIEYGVTMIEEASAEFESLRESSEESPIYVFPRYTITTGDLGIQGNLNSCYLDTSIFAIFTFNMFLDNMLLDKNGNKDTKELRDILRDEIVYPLRRSAYVSYHQISKFRDKLQSLSPDGKFVINERDPEELFEQLFKLLTPQKYLLRTQPINNMDNVQKCFLTQIFYQSDVEKKNVNLLEMLTLTFLEFEMLISKPPKCLILQLPRDGKDMKMFKRVLIPDKLDITPFIIASPKRCKDCSEIGTEVHFCQECSLKRLELTYFCKDHRLNCQHKKVDMPREEPSYQGKVVLELVSVLCIEKNHYVTFVKTNEVMGKWVYFNSMENIKDGIFSPYVRETNLHKYFAKSCDDRKNAEYDKDVDRIENYAFVLVYKYPSMEFYGTDFNSD